MKKEEKGDKTMKSYYYVDKDGTEILSNTELVKGNGYWRTKYGKKRDSRKVTILEKGSIKKIFGVNLNWDSDGVEMNELINRSNNIKANLNKIQNKINQFKDKMKAVLRFHNNIDKIPDNVKIEILKDTIINDEFKNLIIDYINKNSYNKKVKINLNIQNPMKDIYSISLKNIWASEYNSVFLYKVSQTLI